MQHAPVDSVRRRPYKLVVIGASAGGLKGLMHLCTKLPGDFPLPIAVVQHVEEHRESLLSKILNRHSHLHARVVENGESPRVGVVHVAPSGYHLLLADDGTFELNHAAPVHFSRPSIDRLFTTAAEHAGRLIGIVLSGTGRDGTAGAGAIHTADGVVIAEDPATAQFPGMPQAVIDSGVANYVVDIAVMPQLMIDLASGVEVREDC